MKASCVFTNEPSALATTKVNLPVSQYDLFRANTGWKQSPEQYRENAKRRAVLTAQTKRIADALDCWHQKGNATFVGKLINCIF